MNNKNIKIAVIGGSGLYQVEGAKVTSELEISTPFGSPSDKITIVDFDGIQVGFLPRHHRSHQISPSEIPAKANIFALKTLGVKMILSISAVGSLKEEIAPEDFVLPDQIIDRTKSRPATFFEKGIVGHIPFADPFCLEMNQAIGDVLQQKHSKKIHRGGTYICMEGPAFSTRAESNLYRSWGASVIGMTALPEAKLAREAELSYAMIAMSTDYDCWKIEEKPVTVDMIIKHMKNNTTKVKTYLPEIIKSLDNIKVFPYENAAEFAVITSKESISQQVKEKLNPLYGKYF